MIAKRRCVCSASALSTTLFGLGHHPIPTPDANHIEVVNTLPYGVTDSEVETEKVRDCCALPIGLQTSLTHHTRCYIELRSPRTDPLAPCRTLWW